MAENKNTNYDQQNVPVFVGRIYAVDVMRTAMIGKKTNNLNGKIFFIWNERDFGNQQLQSIINIILNNGG